MSDINVWTGSGRLTRDPELKFTSSGAAVCTAGIAVNKKYGGKETTNFFDLVIWSKPGETFAEYMKKGSQVMLTGELNVNQWEKDGEKKSRLEIIVQNFTFGSKKEG